MIALPVAGGANAVFEGASLILGGVVANVAGEEMGAVFFRSAAVFKGAILGVSGALVANVAGEEMGAVIIRTVGKVVVPAFKAADRAID